MGFPAMDRGGSLEAQRYYGGERAGYWVSVQGGWVDRIRLLWGHFLPGKSRWGRLQVS